MGNKRCEILYKNFIHIKKTDLIIKTHNAAIKALETPMVGTIMAAGILASMQIQIQRLNESLINGPICGARVIRMDL